MVKVGIPELWMRPKGLRLSVETRVKEASFQMFRGGSDRGAISYFRMERVPKTTEGI